MYLTYQMILGVLTAEALEVKVYAQDSNPALSGVELYMAGVSGHREDVLYIAPIELAAAACGDKPLAFLCTCDRPLPASLITGNYLAVASGVSATELLNRVNRVFSTLSQWVFDMQNSVIASEGVQALLDLSRPLLKNPVVLVDLTYKVLAHTLYSAPDSKEDEDTLKSGLSLDDFSKLRNMELNTEDGLTEPVICKNRSVLPYPVVKRTFRLSAAFSIYAVMPCCEREFSPGLAQLFSLMCQFIEAYVKRGYPYEGKFSAFDSLLQDFLDGHLQEETEIALRVSRASLPRYGLFDLYQIALADAANQPLAYLAMELQSRMPNSYVSFYQKSIVLLNLYTEENTVRECSRKNLRTIYEVLKTQIQGVGVCNLFSDLSQIRTAFLQTKASLTVGLQKGGCSDSGSGVRVYLFEEWYMDHIFFSLREITGELYDNCFARRTLNRLLELTKRQNYNYIGFLYTYLLEERRPSAVSRKLNLHRNTVIYHIHKVEDALGCSLENPEVRLKLLFEIVRYSLEHQAQSENSPLLRSPGRFQQLEVCSEV